MHIIQYQVHKNTILGGNFWNIPMHNQQNHSKIHTNMQIQMNIALHIMHTEISEIRFLLTFFPIYSIIVNEL